MKNETIVLIVAFIAILYVMFHHNQTVSAASNTSPAFGAIGTSGIGATPYTCTGPTCRGGAPGPIDIAKITGPGGPYVDPHSGGGDASIRTPPLIPRSVGVSQITPPKFFTWQTGKGKALIL